MCEFSNEEKIILATRTKSNSYDDCIEGIKARFNKDFGKISSICIVCDSNKKNFDIEGIPVEVVFNKDPIKACAFNSVIDKLNKECSEHHHLLTFSKEVDLKAENIEKMISEIKENIIVAGYRLKDNILGETEANIYANGDLTGEDIGIAYKVPWNTCALWNKKFVYGTGKQRLWFDEICESENNQFGVLLIKGFQDKTEYEGMEDGLAIAKLVYDDSDLKCKLIKNPLPWTISGDDSRKMKHRLKMARKNIVLSTFINIKGYSVEKLNNSVIFI
jgi:hypothetical protein